MKSFEASMPSNIALIKYMGKTDSEVNLPTNPSLSYTLNHLKTQVRLSLSDLPNDTWEPLNEGAFVAPKLSKFGVDRFLKHFRFLKAQLGLSQNFIIQSGSNFPSDCGLASSASSFAALTMATFNAAKEISGSDLNLKSLAMLSRQGSGSSCRSFFSPWCEWEGERVELVDLSLETLPHNVVIVEAEKKKISSSEAHRRVPSSLLFRGRVERATQRCELLKSALIDKDYSKAFELCWAEFWDMHALFETSSPGFGYMTDKSLKVINLARDYWDSHGEGPIVTMDAGANVHLLNSPQGFIKSPGLSEFTII